jgi:hypothetical protein
MNRLYFYTLIFICLSALNGCGFVVVSAVNTARGGENDLYIVDSVQDLSSFTSIKIIQFTGGTNERLTPELLTYLNNEIHNRLSENGVNMSKEGQLRVSGSVIYLIDSFSSKQILVEVSLEDSTTGHFLGSVNVLGEAIGLRGIETAADEIADGITELLKKHHYPIIEN